MAMQTTTIEVDQATAALIRTKAEARGLTVADWLRALAESESNTIQSAFFEVATPEERAKAVEEWASHNRSSAPPLSDEAISRNSIYGEREDKQL